MRKSDWTDVRNLYALALERPRDERVSFVRTQSADSELTNTVLRLLRSADLQTGFFETGGGIDPTLTTLFEGEVLGNWRIKSLQGQGGMGEVYLAERSDGHYDQVAALKLISSTAPNVWARFSRERQILAQLEHPNIGRLIDGGIYEDGRPWLVMEYITGRTLDAVIADETLSQHDRLGLFMTLCEAVSYAHETLILHRDIKPGNILITEKGGLKLIDFGVAGLLAGTDDDLNAPMTIAYAAPEQIDGAEPTIRTDIFALGLVLFEVLSGRRAERNDGATEFSPHNIPFELLAIVQKATAEKAEDRYRSVELLQLDIDRYRQHYPVSAVSDTSGYRVSKFLKRNRATVGLTTALMLTLTGGLIGTTLQTLEANAQRKTAEIHAERADERSEVTAVAVRMFADLTGQAISEADEGTLNFPKLLNEVRDKAIAELDEDPASARNILYTLSQIHDRREDVTAVMETLQPIYDAPNDRPDFATALSLMRYGFYAGQNRDIETANKALDRSYVIMKEQPERFDFNLINLKSLRAQYSQDPKVITETIADLNQTVAEYLDPDNDKGSENDAVFLLSQIAFIHFQKGEPDKALPLIEQALDVNRNIVGAKGTPDEQLLFPLVRIYTRMGSLEEAAKMSYDLIEAVENTAGPSRRLASRMSQHAEILGDLGQDTESLPFLERAYSLYHEYEPAPSVGALSTGLKIANIHAKLGEAVPAKNRLLAEKKRFDDVIQAGGYFRFLFFEREGDVNVSLNAFSQARQSYRTALAEKGDEDIQPTEIEAVEAKLAAIDN